MCAQTETEFQSSPIRDLGFFWRFFGQRVVLPAVLPLLGGPPEPAEDLHMLAPREVVVRAVLAAQLLLGRVRDAVGHDHAQQGLVLEHAAAQARRFRQPRVVLGAALRAAALPCAAAVVVGRRGRGRRGVGFTLAIAPEPLDQIDEEPVDPVKKPQNTQQE